jgi:hypothetical protein
MRKFVYKGKHIPFLSYDLPAKNQLRASHYSESLDLSRPFTLKSLIFLVNLYFSGYFGLAFQPFRNLKAGKATKNVTLQATLQTD